MLHITLLKARGVFKCLLLIFLISCCTVFISFLYLSRGNVVELDYEDDLQFSPRTALPFSEDLLDENFQKCLFFPLTSDLGGTNTSIANLFTLHSQTTKGIIKVKKSPVFHVLKVFADLMSSFFRIETVLIEPSVLFCMLASHPKNLLLRRNFYLKNFTNSMHIVTLGIRGKDVAELEKPDTKTKLKAYGFRMEIVNKSLLPWMKAGNATFHNDQFTSHLFFKNKDWIIHVVPFYERGDFLWHSSISVTKNSTYNELCFTESDSAYENFTFQSLGFKDSSLANINIPSSPHYFLFETMNSKFLECNATIVTNFFKFNQTGIPNEHRSLSVAKFNERVEASLQDLKAIFNPLLMNFWIWSGTMLGWYRQCDVIPYTSDADYAAWASEVDDLDEILQRIEKSKNLKISERMGVVETGLEFNLNCHRLRVDIFFLYPESNGTWYAGHRPSKGYYFKYHHPNFSLCSAELLGHKVLVPCEAENVIVTEYGSDWMTPVSRWNYETSIQNRGPNIYWDKSTLKKVYPSN